MLTLQSATAEPADTDVPDDANDTAAVTATAAAARPSFDELLADIRARRHEFGEQRRKARRVFGHLHQHAIARCKRVDQWPNREV